LRLEGALQVPRAETRLTVYRPRQYRTSAQLVANMKFVDKFMTFCMFFAKSVLNFPYIRLFFPERRHIYKLTFINILLLGNKIMRRIAGQAL